MSPEKNITSQQSIKLIEWIGKNKTSTDLPLQQIEEGWLIGTVKKEPIILENIFGFTEFQYKLLCSNNHAQELEEEGIVPFPKPQPKK
jgi:hypothetical protein